MEKKIDCLTTSRKSSLGIPGPVGIRKGTNRVNSYTKSGTRKYRKSIFSPGFPHSFNSRDKGEFPPIYMRPLLKVFDRSYRRCPCSLQWSWRTNNSACIKRGRDNFGIIVFLGEKSQNVARLFILIVMARLEGMWCITMSQRVARSVVGNSVVQIMVASNYPWGCSSLISSSWRQRLL